MIRMLLSPPEQDSITVSLRNDIIFKYVFGHEKNEKILRSLLNAILGMEGDEKITELTLLCPANLKEFLQDKFSTLDIKAQDNTGKRYNIEMQVRAESSYIARAIYYHDRLYTSHLEEGKPFRDIRKTISISIVNFILLATEGDLHNIYRYANIKSGKELTELKEMHFVELPKFQKEKPRKLMTKFEKWLYALKFGELHADKPDTLPDQLRSEEEIVMALHEMKKASSDPIVRELMEAREKALHDEAERMAEAEEKGMAKGKSEDALKMKQKGFDIDTIAEITGLSKEQIERLK